MDPDLWKNPELFKYDRFLSVDRTKFVKDEHMIAFGYGNLSAFSISLSLSLFY